MKTKRPNSYLFNSFWLRQKSYWWEAFRKKCRVAAPRSSYKTSVIQEGIYWQYQLFSHFTKITCKINTKIKKCWQRQNMSETCETIIFVKIFLVHKMSAKFKILAKTFPNNIYFRWSFLKKSARQEQNFHENGKGLEIFPKNEGEYSFQPYSQSPATNYCCDCVRKSKIYIF